MGLTHLQLSNNKTSCVTLSELGLPSTKFIPYQSTIQKLRNNIGQVVRPYVPSSPSSITWPKGVDALWLGM